MSDTAYEIHEVSDWLVVSDEPMGTKPKYWLQKPNQEHWLFKLKFRAHSDDDWSEKIASELAGLLDIPHAQVELARRNGDRGVISLDLVSTLQAEELILGNSLLLEDDSNYPSAEFYHVAHHTIERIFTVLSDNAVALPPNFKPASGIRNARELFVGFLLFDAWIGNTDRHHQNWAVLKFPGCNYSLSPSYDHASSLGHNLQDREREERLNSRDKNRQLAAYAAKARSAIYLNASDKKPLSTDGAFLLARDQCPEAGKLWLDKLRLLVDEKIADVVQRVPGEIMSELAKRFVVQLLREG
jgi:hypothetical protein